MATLTRDNLLTLEAYAKIRKSSKPEAIAHRKLRSVGLGEHMTLQFEDEKTIRRQIQEMLHIEKIFEEEGILSEIEAYAPLVSPGSYCVVFDTIVDEMPKSAFPNRPWGPGDNPKTAVRSFLAGHPEFAIDAGIHQKLLVTVAPEGFLKRLG
jgi:cephalosporin hydroxylase